MSKCIAIYIKWQCERGKTGSLHTGQLYRGTRSTYLAAKALITDWESEQKEKKSIVNLNIESCVISSHTAFITIDEESSEPISGAMKTYDTSARWCGSNSSSLYSGSDSGMIIWRMIIKMMKRRVKDMRLLFRS